MASVIETCLKRKVSPCNYWADVMGAFPNFWSRRIMETFSQIALVTPRNQRVPLRQVSLFLRYQRIDKNGKAIHTFLGKSSEVGLSKQAVPDEPFCIQKWGKTLKYSLFFPC